MKLLREDCPLAVKIQQIEDLMREHDIEIDYAGGWLFLRHKGQQFRLVDLSSTNAGSGPSVFPRSLDEERWEVDE